MQPPFNVLVTPLDVLVLSWKTNCTLMKLSSKGYKIKYIFRPSLTWSRGRNILFKHAMNLTIGYLYYIFMDGDLTFSFTSSEFKRMYYKDNDSGCLLKVFEKHLLKHEPAIVVPHFSHDLDTHPVTLYWNGLYVYSTLYQFIILDADLIFCGQVLESFLCM